jgi:flagellar motor switch protein FliM
MAEDNKAVKDDDGVSDHLSGRILEQGEIDGLLKGSNSDHRGLNALVQPTVVSYERMPMLEVVFEGLVRLLSTSLRQFTSDHVDVKLVEMTSVRFKDYIDGVGLPSMINVIKINPWDTEILMVLDNPLIYTVVDILLGGKREEIHEVANRSYTTIERTLNEEFIRVVLQDFSKAFEAVETNPRFAMIERPVNACVKARLEINMDGRGGVVEFCLPYASIEPVREQLLQMFVGEKFGHDKIWESHLVNEIWNTTIEVEALLDKVTMKLSDVLTWKVGSFLPLETFEGANVLVHCGDCKLYAGKIGNVRKRVAVQIEENYLTKETE